jgi:hypothetical protein
MGFFFLGMEDITSLTWNIGAISKRVFEKSKLAHHAHEKGSRVG